MCGELGEPAAALEIEVPAIGPLSAFSLPLPVTVINWPRYSETGAGGSADRGRTGHPR